MALKVEIFSRETIKPSSTTPKNHTTFNLSLLDQLALDVYVPIILFYSTSIKSSNHLKQSLSETLTHMYPLAGRIKDALSIECKDQGVEYVEALVNDNMSTVLEHPKIAQLQQLLPCDPKTIKNIRSSGSERSEPGDQALLLVQVNRFNCGGTAVAVCIRHIIADFAAAGTFLKTWAAIARGENIVDNFVVDCTPMFPPKDVSPSTNNLKTGEGAESKTKATRFVFTGSNISALKEKATKSGSHSDPPSRVVAVSTFLWASIVEANREGTRKNWNMSILVNLRPKMDAPIRPQCLGNIVHGTTANCEISEGQIINYGVLVKIVTDSIRMVNGEYVKNLYADEDYFEKYTRGVLEFAKYYDQAGWLNTSSWCRYPVYEVDFGWGKPIWAGTAGIPNDFAIFLDTSDGEGIEAWVNLKEEDMEKLEQNPEFLAYVSVAQSL